MLGALRADAYGDKDAEAVDPRLKTAAKLEALALLQKDPKQAKRGFDEAAYLRACVKHGIKED